MATVKYVNPGLDIPAPTDADDGLVLGWSATTGFGWVVGGATGPGGPTGPSGTSGFSGFAGPTGPTGAQGTSGFSGI